MQCPPRLYPKNPGFAAVCTGMGTRNWTGLAANPPRWPFFSERIVQSHLEGSERSNDARSER
jgi:hypothetical protein